MTPPPAISASKESLLQRWQRHLSGRTHVSFQELMYSFRQRQLLETIFCIFDRDSSGSLSESEWIGSIYKIAEVSNRTKDIHSLENYIHKFTDTTTMQEFLSRNDFCRLFEDSSFRRDFCLLFLGETNIITVMEFLDVLRSVANVKTDTKWLSWFAYQCSVSSKKRRINSQDSNNTQETMDCETFKNNFYFKVPELSGCLFNYLDSERTGILPTKSLIKCLETVVDASEIEKVEFLFKIFDNDGDGTINFQQMKLILRCFLENSPYLDVEETLTELSATLFKETDIDRSGDISLTELCEGFRRNEHLFKVLSLSASSWIQPKRTAMTNCQKHTMTIQAYLRNHLGLAMFWSVYTLICIAICINVFFVYIGARAHFLVVIARLNGGMLNFNCALVLVLMLRKHITWLRSRSGCTFLPLDHHIDLHKAIGVIILVETILHTAAHLAYVVHVFYLCGTPVEPGSMCLENALNLLGSSSNITTASKRFYFDNVMDTCTEFRYEGCGGNLNNFFTEAQCMARCKPYLLAQHSYINALFTLKLGLGYITGVIEFVLGAVFYIMSLPYIRKSGYFQLFYWCHLLTLPWLIIMLTHGPVFWKWLLAPGFLYIIEKYLRYRKSRSNKHGETFIMEAILLPSQVIHLVINKPRKFRYKPGDYIYLNIPAVANFEWHPFSISSAPEHKDTIWLHVRACGHWTRRVYELFRTKLQQEHGVTYDDTQNLNFRKSMRSRMSKSYLEGLRGSTFVEPASQHQSKDESQNIPQIMRREISPIHPKMSTLSLPPMANLNISKTMSTHSTLSLHECSQVRHLEKSMLATSNTDSSHLMPIHLKQESTRCESIHQPKTKGLTVPPVGDYCLRISNTSSDCESHGIELNDSRVSDALGYLRMYQNHNRVRFNALEFNDREDLQVLIDGPYGAPSQDIFESEHAVLIAAGIGITPFASILQSIMCRYRSMRHKCPNCDFIWDNPETNEPFVKKVDFIWVTREQRSLEWFISLLARMEIEQQYLRQNSDKDPLMEVHLYVTSAKSAADLKALNIYLSLDLIGKEDPAGCEAIDGIRQRTKHGRPNWDQVFGDLVSRKKGKISVFYCGPPALSGDLARKCRQFGFSYKKELF